MESLWVLLACLQVVAGLFWVLQIIHVIVADVELFEDHKHKLLWFLVVLFAPIVGAVWFMIWRSQVVSRRVRQCAEETAQNFAAVLQAQTKG